MNRIWWAIVLSFVPTVALAQFVDNPAAAGGQRGTDKAAKGAAADQPLGQGPAFGAADANARLAAPPVNRMFDAIDANGDGVLSRAELGKAVVALRKLDIDGDGSITLAEVSGPTGPAGPAAAVNQMVDQTMAQYDKNKDGRLMPDEIPNEAAMPFRMADQNGDGAITRPELAWAMEKMQSMPMGPMGGAGAGGGFNQAGLGQQMMQEWLRLDRNGDGRLSADEVPPQLQARLQGADRNNDRMVDAQELQAFIAQMGQRAARGGFGGDGPMGRGEAPMGDTRGPRRGR
jgi:Ca2+-binding EF-hand superfamily protein